MQPATRRRFLRTTSISALASSVLSALPTFASAQQPAPEAPSMAPAPTTTPSILELPASSPAVGAVLTPFTVFVSGSPSNDAVIYIGEREIPITNRSVIAYLKQLAASG